MEGGVAVEGQVAVEEEELEAAAGGGWSCGWRTAVSALQSIWFIAWLLPQELSQSAVHTAPCCDAGDRREKRTKVTVAVRRLQDA